MVSLLKARQACPAAFFIFCYKGCFGDPAAYGRYTDEKTEESDSFFYILSPVMFFTLFVFLFSEKTIPTVNNNEIENNNPCV